MINDIDKSTMHLVASQVLTKGKHLWFHEQYKDYVFNAIKEEKVMSYYSVNGLYKKCGKTTMLIKMYEELDNSFLITGNSANYKTVRATVRKNDIRETEGVLLLPNKKNMNIKDLDIIKDLDKDSILLLDDSVSEDTVEAIRKYYPDFNLFGFTFKHVVSFI